jgi:FHS family Na+ dependent glucose MFS transporter 1
MMGAVGISGILIGPTLPYLADQVQVSLDTIGSLFVVRSLGGMLGAFVIARIYDRLKGHWVLVSAFCLTALASLAIPFVRSLGWLMAVFVMHGMADALMHVGLNTMLVWGLRDRVGPYMNGMHLMFGIGAIASPLLVAQVLLRTGGIEMAYWAVTALSIMLALALLIFPSPEDPQLSTERVAGKSNSLALSLLFVAFFVAYVGGEVGFGGWIYTYALETGLTDAIGAANLNALFWIGFTVGRAVSIPLAPHVRPRHFLWGNVILLLSFISLALASPGMIWVSVGGIGLAYATMFPQAIAWAERRLNVTGTLTGWFFGGANLSATVVPWLIGQAFVAYGPNALLWGVLIMALMVLTVVFLLSRFSHDGATAIERETLHLG